MINIAICDDEELSIQILRKYVEKYFVNNNTECKITTFINGVEMLTVHRDFDLVFLDVEMNEMDGITTAEVIRAAGNDVPIVYVTNYDRYWHRAYKVHAFDYVPKPVEEQQIIRVLNDYIKLHYSAISRKILFKEKNKDIFLEPNEIIYFYVKDKGIIDVCTVNEKFELKCTTLNEIFEKLNDKRFYMCHRSCIVNIDYVQQVENEFDIIMKNGDFCPLSQKKKREFMEYIFNTYSLGLWR